MNQPTRPCDNPFNAQRLDTLPYVEYDHALADVACKLKRHRYRGALVGPHGCGKTTMLQALGDQLMEHGLTPLPLFINSDQRGTLPGDWTRTIRRARRTDALLLDGYDLLPFWARVWALSVSKRAGALVVTAHQQTHLTTVARLCTSPELLQQLIQRLAPSVNGTIDADRLYRDTQGNLRDALRKAYDLYAQATGA